MKEFSLIFSFLSEENPKLKDELTIKLRYEKSTSFKDSKTQSITESLINKVFDSLYIQEHQS